VDDNKEVVHDPDKKKTALYEGH
jgi:hypothetical protein